jgi:multiple sugar transport system ATP-binding protein
VKAALTFARPRTFTWATPPLRFLATKAAYQLSGGQRQRVALGRAIVRDPKVFLFDEPLSNLDAALRQTTRLELARLHQRLAATMVYVTHDQVEAMTLGDRICVMEGGRVAQIGKPMDVYRRPASTFVARFLGSPPMNLVEARVDGGVVRLGAAALPLDAFEVNDLDRVTVRYRGAARAAPFRRGRGLPGSL